MVMAMVMNLCSAFSIDILKCALQASDLWVRSDISIPVYTHLLLHKLLIFVRLRHRQRQIKVQDNVSQGQLRHPVSMDTAQHKKAV